MDLPLRIDSENILFGICDLECLALNGCCIQFNFSDGGLFRLELVTVILRSCQFSVSVGIHVCLHSYRFLLHA